MQRADELRAPPFQNAHHRAGFRRLGAGPETCPPHVAPHQHAVLVQRRARRVLRHGDFLEAGVVRLEKAIARAVHPDAARNQIRLARLHVAIALDARDLAGLLQLLEHGLQFLLAMRRQPEPPEQFRHVQRDVIFLAQQTDDLFFHKIQFCFIARSNSCGNNSRL